MRYTLLLFLFALFLNCEDKQTKRKNTLETPQTKTEKKQTQKDTDTIGKRPFPKLNSRSAMDFFLKYNEEHKENKVRIFTDFGNIDILLFNETRFHRSNFIFLTKQKYYDGTQFYRVVPNFIIQGGNGDDKITPKKRAYIGKYLLPADTKRGFKHDRGVVSMPSSEIDNPHKLASPYEFFIVQQKGGAYHLDGDYTIFGKVINGMDVVDKIADVDTDDGEWPMQNVYIRKVEIIE
ncbi:peptidylprolyl isomerase [Seonamhaeicola aphaedonensis]|uniref:Peptidyl-prolyl cis-trans isomerase n=1 Tax=Seonamhaeicola aphaedonensis TaxID=1461338 RepID=A0A3D9HD96_9FLAO|nr:peptidylprolyl isomerase [Seonamhaeicola aphaedonensis]RED47433.1 cyclophilin family peptidyl-prolyl cis-trans isomerase [Seonamhaeicola aphaedonensis]